jgi:UDP-N-acetylglucosamine 3-dehydrogenase
MGDRIRLGLVGAGVMGSHHARVAAGLADAEITIVVDPDEDRGRKVASQAGAQYSPDLDELINRADAAIVASPAQTHEPIATALLDVGLDVLVEKPIAVTVEQADKLAAAAARTDRILMVGHVERFNPAIAELVRQVDGLMHIDIRRVGPFSPRVATDVVLDLMIHDADLVLLLAGSTVRTLTAVTRSARTEQQDMATCMLTFANGVSATLTASRLSQVKQRQVELTQRDNVVVADLVQQQVTVHRVHHAEFTDGRGPGYRQSGVIEIPYLENRGEPLARELSHFVAAVRDRTRPQITAADGLAALALALRIRDEAVSAHV